MEPLRAFIAASVEVADAAKAREAARAAEEKRKQRRNFRIVASMAGAMLLLAVLAGLAAIAANDARKLAEEERNQALITQSRFLADKADDVSQLGDYGTAVALALEALPDQKRGIKRPYVAKAESMLYRAVMALREQKTFPVALKSPDSVVRGGAVSPDGRRVLISSSRQTRLFAADTGAEIKRISDQQPDIDDVSFTPDGRWVVTTARDNALRVYRADDGSLIHKLSMELPDGSSILEYASSPDGRHIVATSRRGPPICGMPKPGRWPGRCPRACRSVLAHSRPTVSGSPLRTTIRSACGR